MLQQVTGNRRTTVRADPSSFSFCLFRLSFHELQHQIISAGVAEIAQPAEDLVAGEIAALQGLV